MNRTRQFLIDSYLDYFNNYLTVALFSEHRGISPEEGRQLIDLGRLAHENHLTLIRSLEG